MRAYLIQTNVLNFAVLISFVFAFSYVFLNYTFAHTNLPDDNIPFFISDDAAKVGERGSGRYGLYWWILASGVTRILIPFLLLINIIFMKAFGPGVSLFVRLIFALVFIWEWIKFIWLIFLWIPTSCKNHQFCRNFGSRRELMVEIGDDPEEQNAVFTFDVYYTLAFAFVMIFYLVLVDNIKSNYAMTKKAKVNAKIEPVRLWGNVILGSILTLGMLFYFSFVVLNFTFTTHKTTNAIVAPDLLVNLPDSNIPYYIDNNPANPTELNSGRLELYWWFLATDTLLILVPSVVLTAMVLEIFRYRSFRQLTVGSLIILLIWQVIKLIWAAALAFPSTCSGHQFCRALGSRRDGGGNEIGDDPGVWNNTYAAYVWFNVGFVVILILYVIVNVERIFPTKKKKKAKKSDKVKYTAMTLNGESPKKKPRSKKH